MLGEGGGARGRVGEGGGGGGGIFSLKTARRDERESLDACFRGTVDAYVDGTRETDWEG